MCFFENDFFIELLKKYKKTIYPILVPVIVKLAETHWHAVMRESLEALLIILH
jgi:serine/threonine-protein phosphatase 2A regulatory subunit B'